MLTTAEALEPKSRVKLTPFMRAVFYIKDAQTLSEFNSFINKNFGLAKTAEFITHICSEILYEQAKEIQIEFRYFKYLSYFIVQDIAFAKKAMEHYLKVRAFLSIEISDGAVILKSVHNNDGIDCKFCKAIQDDDPKIANELLVAGQNLCDLHLDITAKEQIDNTVLELTAELAGIENSILKDLELILSQEDLSKLTGVSIKIFLYSQKLLYSAELYELSINLRSLSFLLQKLPPPKAKTAVKIGITLQEAIFSIAEWRRATFVKDGLVNAHGIDGLSKELLAKLATITGTDG